MESNLEVEKAEEKHVDDQASADTLVIKDNLFKCVEEDKERNTDFKYFPRLKKSSSLPDVYSKTYRADEGTKEEQNEPKLVSLMKENQILRDNLMKLKTKNNEIIAINHDWDNSYITLIQQHAELQKQYQKHTEQFTLEVSKREEEKNRLKMKLERFFNEGNIDEKNLLAEEKEEKNKILKREQAAIQAAKDYQLKCQHLDHLLRHTNQQKMNLEREVQRLSKCVESQHQKNNVNKGDGSGINGMDMGELELLRQQLQTYVEDFNAERNEKQRLLQENSDLRIKLSAKMDENQHLKTQLEIYEKDFARQREKRIQELRKSNQLSRTFISSPFNSNAGGRERLEDKHNYNVMNMEKNVLGGRVASLEPPTWSTSCDNSSGNNNYNGLGLPSSNSYQSSEHSVSDTNSLLPRSASPYRYNENLIPDQPLNGKVLLDQEILRQSIPGKVDDYAHFNDRNGTNKSCWSYFG